MIAIGITHSSTVSHQGERNAHLALSCVMLGGLYAQRLMMIVQGRLSQANHVANGDVWRGSCGLYGDE
jgi:hypothetical protein